MKILTSKLLLALLILIWLAFVFTYLHRENYFSFSIEKNIDSLVRGEYRGDPLLKGGVVELDYYSPHPYLNAINIKFNTFYKKNSDNLLFRIKEVGNDNWYFESENRTDQFQQFSYHSFSFPEITNSSGKFYHIEVESLAGYEGNYVAIASPLDHSVRSRFDFSKEKLSENTKLLTYFILHKVLFLVSDPGFLKQLLIYSTPLIFYLLYCLLGSSMGIFSVVIFLSVIIDALFNRGYSAFYLLSVIFGWLLMVLHHRVEGKVTSSLFLSFFSLSAAFFLMGQGIIGDRFGVWSYMFLTFAVTQSVYEIINKPRQLVRLTNYWHDLVAEGKNMALFIYLALIGEVKIDVERGKMSGEKSDITGTTDRATEIVTLVVYRWQAPMVKTYIYTSQFLAYLIVIFIKITSVTLRFGPFVLFGWLVFSITNKIWKYITFFNDFFPSEQLAVFWNQLGKRLFVLYLVVVLISLSLLFIKKLNLRRKTLVVVVLLFLSSIITQTLYLNATPYRNDIKVWSLTPNSSAEPWVDIAIRGRNFKGMPFKGSVWIDNVEQRVIRWSDREIIFRADPFITRSGNLMVKGYNKKTSNSVYFTYTGYR